MSGRLIIVSNRVEAACQKMAANGGGLSLALTAALRKTDGIWFGWSGAQTDQFSGSIHMSRDAGVTTATIDLEEADIDEYYHGFANRTLRPLFHYRVDLAEFARGFAGGYERVNGRFAETLLPLLLADDDLVWVNDRHLIHWGPSCVRAVVATGWVSSSTSPGRRCDCSSLCRVTRIWLMPSFPMT